jgi:hypothetical protein
MPEPSVQEWLAKAEEDEVAGKDILAAAHFYGPACFHFQQTPACRNDGNIKSL